MMLTDPWDLKHQIEQLQQQQRHKKILIKQQQQHQSSSNLSVFDDTLDIVSESQTHYVISGQSGDDVDISSDEVEDDEMQDNRSIDRENALQSRSSQQYQQSTTSNSSEFIETVQRNTRKKYGNLIVFFETSYTIFSIGPNYIFFTFAYLCFTLASIYLVKLVNFTIQSHLFRVINFSLCLLQNVTYLLVAFSNPGVKLAQTEAVLSSDQIKNNRLCKKCGAQQQRKTIHCRQCDICVVDYDHHCPWTSKCIGGGNLKRFYLFVGITPFYIFYYIVTFMICMGNLAMQQNDHLKNQSQLTKL